MIMQTIALAALAGFAIYWENRKPFYWHYILKPLTTIGIILIALNYLLPVCSAYGLLIVIGLVFSLGGDVFLMLPKDRFIFGLGSFLVAQITYAIAFTFQAQNHTLVFILPILIFGVWMFYRLKPTLDKMMVPVLIYMLCILFMAWAAVNYWWDGGSPSALFAMLGAILFVISDSILAWNRFRHSFQAARPIILTTYFIAQYLIATSVGN